MAAIVMLVAVPLLILNMLGGLIGGVGLAFHGEWGLLIGGIAWCILGAFVLSLALLPGMLFLPLITWAADREKAALAVLAAAPSLAWTYLVLTVTSLVVFHNVVARPEAGIFHLLWAYFVTTAPWSFLASKDKQAGNDASTMLMFFVQLGTVAMMTAAWSDPEFVDLSTLAAWFIPFMVLGLIAQLFTSWVETRSGHARAW